MAKFLPLIGVLGGLAVVLLIVRNAYAGGPQPPPEGYECPYCTETFETYEDLAAHVQTAHPGERVPLPIEWE